MEEEQNFPTEGSDERRAGESSRKEQAAKDLEESSLAGGAPDPADPKQGNAGDSESREEEDKSLLDKAKDKLRDE